MARGTIFGKAFRDQRRALVGWGVSLALLDAMMLAFWPSLKDQAAEFERLLANYPPAFKALFGEMNAIGTGPGYLQVELFSFMLPLLFAIYAIGRGSDAIAGQEERGSLELLLAEPVSRARILVERAFAIAAGTLVLAAVSWIVLTAGDVVLAMDVGALRLARATLAAALFGLATGALALLVGAARGRRGLAVATGAGVGVGSYLIEALARASGKAEWARPLMPYRHYAASAELVKTFEWWGFIALAGICVAAVALATWAFERRDVGV